MSGNMARIRPHSSEAFARPGGARDQDVGAVQLQTSQGSIRPPRRPTGSALRSGEAGIREGAGMRAARGRRGGRTPATTSAPEVAVRTRHSRGAEPVSPGSRRTGRSRPRALAGDRSRIPAPGSGSTEVTAW